MATTNAVKLKKTSDFGSGPVLGTLFRLSLPAIGMMFLNTLVFLVDSIFVSWLGEAQIAAMSLSLAVSMIFQALMEGVGNGTTALVGQNLGRDNVRLARLLAISGLTLAYTVAVMAVPLFFRPTAGFLLGKLGAMSDPAVLEAAYLYNFWLPLTLPFIAYTYICNCVFRCQGDTVRPLIAMSISNIVNAILDPIFIFTLGWGIEGAAVATIIGRICATVYLYRMMKTRSALSVPVFPIPRRIFAANWLKIALIGLPVALSTGTAAAGFGWLNRILSNFGNYAMAALMMSLRIEDFSFTVIIGVCSALTPFLAYNYGRRDLPRMLEGIRASGIIAGGIMLLIGSIIFVFPHPFIRLFRPSEEAASLTVLAIRLAISSYPFIIVQFILNAFFVATGYSTFGTVAQLVRSIFVRIPAAYFFASLWGDRGIWLFQPASWLFGAIVAWFFASYLVKKIRARFLLEEMRGV